MLKLRKSSDRGHFDFGWLSTFHTFSFGDYHSHEHMGFSVLRVINEDYISAGEGFPTHGHSDMEIITYVIRGALEHKDSMGNTAIIKPGEVQRMSAGTGVRHSEFNHLKDQKTHILQIWILPEKKSVQPSYEQKDFSEAFKTESFKLVASQDGAEGSVSANQDFKLYSGHFKPAESKTVPLNNRSGWVQLISGQLSVNHIVLNPGDGIAISDEASVTFESPEKSHFLFFDLPQ